MLSTGLPCSHMIRYLMENNQDIFNSLTIISRWTNCQDCTLDDTIISYEQQSDIENDSVSLSEKEMFLILRSKAVSLASAFSKSAYNYKIMYRPLDEMQACSFNSETETDSNIFIDDLGILHGRKPNSKKNIKCLLCINRKPKAG